MKWILATLFLVALQHQKACTQQSCQELVELSDYYFDSCTQSSYPVLNMSVNCTTGTIHIKGRSTAILPGQEDLQDKYIVEAIIEYNVTNKSTGEIVNREFFRDSLNGLIKYGLPSFPIDEGLSYSFGACVVFQSHPCWIHNDPMIHCNSEEHASASTSKAGTIDPLSMPTTTESFTLTNEVTLLASTSSGSVTLTSSTQQPFSSSIQLLSSSVQPLSSSVQPLSSIVHPSLSSVQQPSSSIVHPPSLSSVQPSSSSVHPLSSVVHPSLSSVQQPSSSIVHPSSSSSVQPSSSSVHPSSSSSVYPLSSIVHRGVQSSVSSIKQSSTGVSSLTISRNSMVLSIALPSSTNTPTRDYIATVNAGQATHAESESNNSLMADVITIAIFLLLCICVIMLSILLIKMVFRYYKLRRRQQQNRAAHGTKQEQLQQEKPGDENHQITDFSVKEYCV